MSQQPKLTIDIPRFKFSTKITLSANQTLTYEYIIQQVQKIISQYKMLNQSQQYLIYLVSNYKQILLEPSTEFHSQITSIVVYFKNQLHMLKAQIEDLDNWANNQMQVLKKKQDSVISIKYQNNCRKSLLENGVNIVFFVSDPLVKRDKNQDIVQVKFEEVHIMQQFERIKKEVSRNKLNNYHIMFSYYPGIKQSIRDQLRFKMRIVHLIGNVEIIDSVVYLALESKSRTGLQQNVRVEDVFLKTTNNDIKPDLIIIVGYQSSYAAKIIFEQLKYPSVIFVETSHYRTDKFAQTFISRFYFFLSEQNTIRDSFDKAISNSQKYCLKQLKDIKCCCLHQHIPNCKFQIQAQKYGVEICHQRYHNSFPCNCEKGNHKSAHHDCKFSKEMYNIFRQSEELLSTSIDNKYFCKNVCCCSDPNKQRIDYHSEKIKIDFLEKVKENSPIIFKQSDEVRISSFTFLNIKQFELTAEYVFRMNKQLMYHFLDQLKRQQVINVSGDLNAGIGMMVKQSIQYIERRDYLQYTVCYCDLKNLYSFTDFENILKAKLTGNRNNKTLQFKQVLDSVSNEQYLIILGNVSQNMKNQVESLVSLLKQTLVESKIVVVSNQQLKLKDAFHISKSSVLTKYDFIMLYNYRKPPTMCNIVKLDKADQIYQGLIKRTFNSLNTVIKLSFHDSKATQSINEDTKKQRKKRDEEIQKYCAKQQGFNKQWLFKLLTYFENGLTELDFLLFQQIGKQEYKDENWKSFDIIRTKFQKDPNQNKQKFLQLQKFFKIENITNTPYKKISLKSQYKIYWKQKLQQQTKQTQDSTQKSLQIKNLRLTYVRYLNYYIETTIKYFIQNFIYYQSIYQFLVTSDIGFFSISRANCGSFFLKKETYSRKNKERIFENIIKAMLSNPVHYRQNIELMKQTFNTQKDNMLLIDNFKPMSQEQLGGEFGVLYENLLIYIPTVLIIMRKSVGDSLIDNALQKSIQCAESLIFDQKAQYILKVKLKITQFGQKLHTKLTCNPNKIRKSRVWQKPKINQLLQDFDQLQQSIKLSNEQVVRLFPQKHTYVKRFVAIELLSIKIFLYLFLNQQVAEDQLELVKQYIKQLQKIRFQKLTYISKSKLQFRLRSYKLQYNVLRRKDKLQYNSIELHQEISSFPQYQQKNQAYEKSEQKQKPNTNVLNIRKIKLNMIKQELQQLEQQHHIKFQDIRSLINKFQEIDSLINNSQYRINDEKFQQQYQELSQKLKMYLKQYTSQFVIFLESSPYNPSNKESFKNFSRNRYQSRKNMLKMFQDSKKQFFVVFQQMTEKNLKAKFAEGGKLLFLTVDCQFRDDNLFIILEDGKKMTKNQKDVEELRKWFENKDNQKIEIIVICGKNSSKLCKLIKKFHFMKQAPWFISMDTQIFEESIKNQNADSLDKPLKRIILKRAVNYFLQRLSLKLIVIKKQNSPTLKTMNLKDNQKQDQQIFHIKLKQIVQKAFSQTTRFIKSKYDLLNSYEKFVSSLRPKILKGQYFQFSFKQGTCKNMSDTFHKNIELTQESIGRQSVIVRIFDQITQIKQKKVVKKQNFLTLSKIQKKDESQNNIQQQLFQKKNDYEYLNIYGIRGVGKKTIIAEVSEILAEKNKFKDGIFAFDFQLIEKQKQGIIWQYIRQKQKMLFNKLFEAKQKSISLQLLLIFYNFEKTSQNVNNFLTNVLKQTKSTLIIVSTQKLTPSLPKCSQVSVQIPELTLLELKFFIYSTISIPDFYKYQMLSKLQMDIKFGKLEFMTPSSILKMIDEMKKEMRYKDDLMTNRSRMMEASMSMAMYSKWGLNSNLDNMTMSYNESHGNQHGDGKPLKLKVKLVKKSREEDKKES